MKLRKFHPTDTDSGCGAAVLALLFGGKTKGWRRKICSWRKDHIPPPWVSYRMADLNPTDSYDRMCMRDWCYDNEMQEMLKRELGKKRVAFRRLKRRINITNFKLPCPMALVMMEGHFVVMQGDYTFDGQSFNEHKSKHRHKSDLVESYYPLNGWEAVPVPPVVHEEKSVCSCGNPECYRFLSW